jgi:GntR family transcriptional regulator
MLLHLETHGGPPIYLQMIAQIRRMILTGQLAQGEQIEQVRSLAARLRINPMTVSKAYSILEREGFLERRRGIGLFVASVARDARNRVRAELVEEQFARAAATALQMGLTEDEAAEALRKCYRRIQPKKERREP